MIKNILWDFDGVILDSMEVRDLGFMKIFQEYENDNVQALLDYHRLNGGLSRYVKIRYFFESILNEKIMEEDVHKYASQFSSIMRKELVNPTNLIIDTLQFIKENHKKYNFHIVSGSDQEELRFLCQALNIAVYFKSIHGSPTPKNDLVAQLIKSKNYQLENCVLIGDSINDYNAAIKNKINFYGYNNRDLEKLNSRYIISFDNFQFKT